ncbi:MAG: hypothetical protein KBT04_08100, partial [Bacteroidales bacterium]|nr:hypothetical protein [Candidatus Colimorpha onthohippi]
MRKTLSFLIFFFAISIAQYMSAQAPQAITYQSVVRDSQGKLLVNTPIDVHVSILRQSADGEVVYAESHSVVTNSNGLLSLLIGYGDNVSGSFAAIQWHTSVFYLRSDIFLPGTQVPLTTIMQFVSVPYALSSAVADTAMLLKMGNTIFTGSYNQLTDLPTMPMVPTQVSAFVNDAGYLTHDSLPAVQPIPTQISAFVNDAGYLTHDSLPAIPTQVSVLDNDAGYLTAEYQTLSDVAALGNDMGNKQLKGLQDPTESHDAVTYHLLQDVQGLIVALQTQIDSLNHVVDSMRNSPANPVFTLPSIVTAAVINISDTEALLGGHLLSSGGAMVTARGICWTSDSLALPTIAHCDGAISDSACLDSFSVLVTGLDKGTTYYARAYASNFLGISYGDVVSFVAQAPCDSTFGGSTVTKGDKGALPGLFSVSYNKKVYFSAGNLQYSTRGTHDCIDGTRQPGTWCFANNQYDYIGCSNRYIDASYSGWIDLFGWGTSGYHNPSDSYNTNYYPYSSSVSEVKPSYNDYGYGPSFTMADNNLVGSSANYDWGVYNAISNGGNTPGMWRTLTLMEWAYLYLARPEASSKWGSATVNGNHGIIFLPDEWTLPEGSEFTPGSGEEWLTNVYSDSQWMAMENAGALFLPAAGYRLGQDIDDVGAFSYYWSSSATNSGCADYLNFGSLGEFGMYYYASHVGLSVRLVCDETPQRSLPTVSTATASVVVNTGAVLGGEVLSDGGSAITARGVCWDTTGTPTVNSCLGMTVDGTGLGQFSSIATGLDAGT